MKTKQERLRERVEELLQAVYTDYRGENYGGYDRPYVSIKS